MFRAIKRCLAEAVDQEKEFGACLLYGEESYPRSLLLQAVQKISRENESVTVERYDCSQLTLAEVIGNWDALSLFAPRKIIVLTSVEEVKKKDAELLRQWLEDHWGTRGSYLFLLARSFDGRSALYRALKKRGEVLKTDGLQVDEIRRLVTQKAAACGVSLAPGILDSFLHYHDNNLQMIMQEVEKLALYVGPEGTIGQQELELLGCSTAAARVFDLVDELAAARLPASLRLLDRLLRDKTVPLVILHLVVRHYRLLALAASPANRKKAVGELASALRVPPFVVRKLRRQSEKFSLPRLAGAFQLLSDVDRQLKSSRLPERIVLERMVIALCREQR